MQASLTEAVSRIERGCEICGANGRRIAHRQRFVTFDHDVGLLAGYAVAVCVACGFVYADGIPEPAVFERYYREMSKHEPAFDAQKPIPSYRQHNIDLIACAVATHFPKRSTKILDVGVGSGELLLALLTAGYRDLTGLDPSPRTANIVQVRHEIRMLNTPVSQLQSSEERYDVILLSGVLEHLRDLHSTLLSLKSLLREGGSLCIAVPNVARFTECAEAPFQYFSIEHINFFTKQTLASLFGSVGMEQHGNGWESTALLGVFREPIVHGIFRAAASMAGSAPDATGSEHVDRYVALCHERQNALMESIRDLIESRDPILVWGAGSLTMHLLSDARFSKLCITGFVDSNENYWDKTILGMPVLSPGALRDRDETILIVSYSYEDEIHCDIRNVHRLNNRVVRLFDRNRHSA